MRLNCPLRWNCQSKNAKTVHTCWRRVCNFLYLSCSCFCAAYNFSYHLNLFMSLLLLSGRENMKHHIRKVSKDLQKLFNKKSSIDVVNASETSKQCPQGYLKYNKENKTWAFDWFDCISSIFLVSSVINWHCLMRHPEVRQQTIKHLPASWPLHLLGICSILTLTFKKFTSLLMA